MVLHGRGARPLMLAPAACGGVWGRVASEDERPERPHEKGAVAIQLSSTSIINQAKPVLRFLRHPNPSPNPDPFPNSRSAKLATTQPHPKLVMAYGAVLSGPNLDSMPGHGTVSRSKVNGDHQR